MVRYRIIKQNRLLVYINMVIMIYLN